MLLMKDILIGKPLIRQILFIIFLENINANKTSYVYRQLFHRRYAISTHILIINSFEILLILMQHKVWPFIEIRKATLANIDTILKSHEKGF